MVYVFDYMHKYAESIQHDQFLLINQLRVQMRLVIRKTLLFI
jgi:hypothetical protein